MKKLTALICSLLMTCTALAGCGEKSSTSSSKAETTTTTAQESQAEEVGTTDYDVNGDVRLFDDLKSKYDKNYLMNFTEEKDGQKTDYTMCIKDSKSYISNVVSGMKSYRVYPDDGSIYVVSEATTTYQVIDGTEDYVTQSDFLFGATADFEKAEIDTETNTVNEYYSLDEAVTGSNGTNGIIYGFDGETYELKTLTISFEDSEATVYSVTSLTQADENLLAVPDLSGYTKQ